MSESKPEAAGAGPAGMTQRDLFLGLVQSLQIAALQQLGRIPSPSDGTVERDLTGARLSIDILEMIRARTAGNLTMEEGKFLDHVLTELRMLYVTEAAKPSAEAPGPPAQDPSP